MANLFVQGLRESGFGRAVSSSQLVDDSYYQKGADVWVLWSSAYHDCFVGYEGRTTTTKKQTTTTTKATTAKPTTTTTKPTTTTTTAEESTTTTTVPAANSENKD